MTMPADAGDAAQAMQIALSEMTVNLRLIFAWPSRASPDSRIGCARGPRQRSEATLAPSSETAYAAQRMERKPLDVKSRAISISGPSRLDGRASRKCARRRQAKQCLPQWPTGIENRFMILQR